MGLLYCIFFFFNIMSYCRCSLAELIYVIYKVLRLWWWAVSKNTKQRWQQLRSGRRAKFLKSQWRVSDCNRNNAQRRTCTLLLALWSANHIWHLSQIHNIYLFLGRYHQIYPPTWFVKKNREKNSTQ